MNRFSIEIGEPSVVAQGENTGWGNYQFPDICYTKNGSIHVTWAMRPDTVEAFAGKSYGEAVSDDLGKTWHERRESDILTAGTPLKNGKIFKGFRCQYAFASDYIKNYTPVAIHRGRKYHYLEDIKEYESHVEGVERDPITGEESPFPIDLKWKNLSLIEYSDGRLLPTAYMMAVCGSVPRILRLEDGLYFATYHWSFDIHAETREKAVNNSYLDYSVFVFRSTDEARTWECISMITPDESVHSTADGYEGFCEPQMELMEDGSVVMLMRSGSPRGPRRFASYIARSTDGCRTWSKPEVFDEIGVLPQIMRLGCGVTLATYGRPVIYLKATDDVSGREWTEHIEIELSPSTHDRSCCYTRILPIDDHSALLVYSDFNYPDKISGEPKKSILVRKITVIKQTDKEKR